MINKGCWYPSCCLKKQTWIFSATAYYSLIRPSPPLKMINILRDMDIIGSTQYTLFRPSLSLPLPLNANLLTFNYEIFGQRHLNIQHSPLPPYQLSMCSLFTSIHVPLRISVKVFDIIQYLLTQPLIKDN